MPLAPVTFVLLAVPSPPPVGVPAVDAGTGPEPSTRHRLVDFVRRNVIGSSHVVPGPFGPRQLTYTGSGFGCVWLLYGTPLRLCVLCVVC